jgi:hypothetical protein
VVLHDHVPGTTPAGSADAAAGRNGVAAVYPDGVAPTESLERLVGETARGTWTLTAGDETPGPEEGVTPILVGWALQITAGDEPSPPSPGPGSFWLPVVAHAAGANGTLWVSDVRVFNPSLTDDCTFDLFLVPTGVDGAVAALQRRVVAPARSVLDLPDVVQGEFDLLEVQGNLLVDPVTGSLVGTSRTYNSGGGDGTFGQFVGMVRSEQAVGAGEPPVVILQLAAGADFRSNIGVSEVVGADATVAITLRDGDSGAVLGTEGQLSVRPFSNAQANRVFDQLAAGSSANAFAEVEVVSGAGRVVVYGSVVDNSTGDAILVPAQVPDVAASRVIPIVARISGQAGTSWKSDLRVLNADDAPVTLQLQYRPEVGSPGRPQTALRTVAPGRVLALNDVLGELFGLSSAAGSLRLVATGEPSPFLVTTRTYNQTDAGTYGQFIPAAAEGFTRPAPATVLHVDRNGDRRTNIGVCEVGGGAVDLRYVLKNADGVTLGVGQVALGAYEVQQINDVYGALGVPDEDNTRVDFFMDAGDGAFTAYASVVDNLSGDAVFVPAVGS